jgi:phage tail tape-measure protein
MAGEGAKRLATGVLRRNVISSVAIGCAEQIYDTVQYNRGHISSDEYRRRSGSNVGGVGGAAGGAWLGSFVCPVVGTAVGAAIGSVVGSWLGRQSVD